MCDAAPSRDIEAVVSQAMNARAEIIGRNSEYLYSCTHDARIHDVLVTMLADRVHAPRYIWCLA